MKLKLVLALLLAGTLFGQSFSVIQHHSSITDTLGKEIIFNFTVINTTADNLSLYIKRTVNNIPEEWQSSLCFTSCFAPFVDSIATTSTYFSEPIVPGDSIEVSIHIFTQIAGGEGRASLRFGNMNNPNDTATFSVYTTTQLTSVEESQTPVSVFLLSNYPNPFNPETTVKFRLQEAGPVTITAVSVTGQTIFHLLNKYMNIGEHNLHINFSSLGLSTGVYIIQMRSGYTIESVKAVYLK